MHLLCRNKKQIIMETKAKKEIKHIVFNKFNSKKIRAILMAFKNYDTVIESEDYSMSYELVYLNGNNPVSYMLTKKEHDFLSSREEYVLVHEDKNGTIHDKGNFKKQLRMADALFLKKKNRLLGLIREAKKISSPEYVTILNSRKTYLSEAKKPSLRI